MSRRVAATALSLVALLAAGCGGGSKSSTDPAADAQAATEEAPAPAVPQLPLPGGSGGSGSGSGGGVDLSDPRDPKNPASVPRSVPVTGTEPADSAQEAVVERWSKAISQADWKKAGATFADGAKVRNLTKEVLTLRNAKERVAWNELSFSCGSEVTDARDAGRDYLIITFRLTDRRDSSCGAARGNAAQIVVRVQGGKLTGWYRLPDPPSRDVPGEPSSEV